MTQKKNWKVQKAKEVKKETSKEIISDINKLVSGTSKTHEVKGWILIRPRLRLEKNVYKKLVAYAKHDKKAFGSEVSDFINANL